MARRRSGADSPRRDPLLPTTVSGPRFGAAGASVTALCKPESDEGASSGVATVAAELADIARRISPIRAHPAGDFPTLENNSDDVILDALAAGHTDVVSAHPLITMITALRMGIGVKGTGQCPS